MAAINSTDIQKYKAAIPIKEKSNHIADLNIFVVVTASTPVPRMAEEMI
jgi:hypothetical protein